MKPMPGIPLFRSNTILYCSAWQETVAFYRDVLELTVVHANTWFVEFRLFSDAYLSVADTAHASIAASGGNGLTLSFRVTELDRVHDTLGLKGVPVSGIHRVWGARAMVLHDPEGHRIELWE